MNVVLTLLFLCQFGFSQSLEVDVTLSPAGDFVGKTSDVSGTAMIKGESVAAKNIKVSLLNLKTGIDLRDKHTKKYLGTDKFPEAVLIKAVGKNGKGKAKIKFRGVEKTIEGTYKVSGDRKRLNASFPLTLSEFGISGISYMGVGVKDVVKIRLELPLRDVSNDAPTKKAQTHSKEAP
ncbi:YceI family protein [bacterium]|nr:YceI family protein [bacterium]